MEVYFTFTLLFIAAEAVLTVFSFFGAKLDFRPAVRTVLTVLKALVGIACAVVVLAGPVQLRFAQPFLMALYVALLADAAACAVYGIYRRIGKKEYSRKVLKCFSLVFGVLFFVYGVVNMQLVVPKYSSYSSEKLTQEHRFVFLADLHVGSAQSFSVTEKTVEKIALESPEFVILGGDIVDDYTTEAEMKDTFALFGSLGVPVYYIYGNHDRQGHAEYAGGVKFTPEELETTMEDCGVTVLKDKYVSIAPDLVLLGREDISEGEGRSEAGTLVNPAPDSFLIVADHQPVQFKENLVCGTDLQLSGHTHAGQLFPLRAFYSLIGYCSGEYRVNGSVLLVSSGACGWRMPLRTDARCNYEVITLSPAVQES
ncbi:MAG: metallophosphoesterase [Clostridia bacterium]|nr:metallophosphoesterase [Clostridia bacterium]